jgi:hypothetical protein
MDVSPLLPVGGDGAVRGRLVAFGALFAVYAVSLKVAELSTVTFGWIVTLQVGLLLLERIRYASSCPTGNGRRSWPSWCSRPT